MISGNFRIPPLGLSPSSKRTRHLILQYVSDGSADDKVSNGPGLAILYAVGTAIMMLVALGVSFARFRRRRQLLRNNEKDYLEQFERILPGSNIQDMKISRARSVMTNTHLGYGPYQTLGTKHHQQRRHVPRWKSAGPDDATSQSRDAIPASPQSEHFGLTFNTENVKMLRLPSSVGPSEPDLQSKNIASDMPTLKTSALVHTEMDGEHLADNEDFPYADQSEENISALIESSDPFSVADVAISKEITHMPDTTTLPASNQNMDASKFLLDLNKEMTEDKNVHNLSAGSLPIFEKEKQIERPLATKPPSGKGNSVELGYVIRLPKHMMEERRASVPDIYPVPDDEPVELSKLFASDDNNRMFHYSLEGGETNKRMYRRRRRLAFHLSDNSMRPSDMDNDCGHTALVKGQGDLSQGHSTDLLKGQGRDVLISSAKARPKKFVRKSKSVPLLDVSKLRKTEACEFLCDKDNFHLLSKDERLSSNSSDDVIIESKQTEFHQAEKSAAAPLV